MTDLLAQILKHAPAPPPIKRVPVSDERRIGPIVQARLIAVHVLNVKKGVM